MEFLFVFATELHVDLTCKVQKNDLEPVDPERTCKQSSAPLTRVYKQVTQEECPRRRALQRNSVPIKKALVQLNLGNCNCVEILNFRKHSI